ncbi:MULTISPECIES: multicopper oxidase domain-containing protein [Bradyrhizobium]|uniref:multicopper oxidase domain-containing protein n=1 Tax=Bradyrhizobium TaxID=374 RepID=UPI001B8A1C53|nr:MULTISPECIES: multicopper oxidase domain-containing protein [Bradyrhizobium]MBR0975132.1 multicopper oxidase domain-containing protein [Bradyrhizobium japonicum]
MYLSKNESKRRLKEAEDARANRLEIVSALSQGTISKRDLFRWGLLTATGAILAKNGLSPFATSAYAQVPTGTPPSPLFGAKKFTHRMPRQELQKPIPLLRQTNGDAAWQVAPGVNEPAARNFSYHTDYDNSGRAGYRNPVTYIGPMEGRPPGPLFAHQRWEEFYPKVGYLMSMGQCRSATKFCDEMPDQNPNAVWSFGPRPPGMQGAREGRRTGYGAPCLIKARYGEPVLTRIYNDLPVDRALNGGFGRNEISIHFHNAHNGAESDGACNAYHFPGTFYDYHWSTALARRDMPSVWLTSDQNHLRKASGPDDGDGVVPVAGDFRELQGTLWLHDHRFFFTAENVHKGMFASCNFYSGPDRGSDRADRNNINLRLPSGNRLAWGNIDFDVNLAITNPAMDKDGQLFFDIFDTDGFVGDMLLVNGSYYPYFEVLPRRYRFRILNAAMSRFIKLALAVNKSLRFAPETPVPFYFIANDGNFVVSPIQLTQLDEQGVAERYDIVIDFSAFRPGDSLYLLNLLKQSDGRKPDGAVSLKKAFKGEEDPCVGPILEFRVVYSLKSVDDPSTTYTAESPDPSVDLSDPDWKSGRRTLTTQIPVVAPVRERVIEFGRFGDGDSRNNPEKQCIPDCGDTQIFPWSIRVNGQAAHTLNANRISALIPKPGEVEHWTLINGGGGWDHPIHLHFEEGVTINRGVGTIPATELLVRKDVWRLRPDGRVKFQVRFGEFGGAYVNHCHNTVHEDFAMLLRYQLLSPPPGDPDFAKTGSKPHYQPTMTPLPSASGVTWKQPEVLPEADPVNSRFFTGPVSKT